MRRFPGNLADPHSTSFGGVHPTIVQMAVVIGASASSGSALRNASRSSPAVSGRPARSISCSIITWRAGSGPCCTPRHLSGALPGPMGAIGADAPAAIVIAGAEVATSTLIASWAVVAGLDGTISRSTSCGVVGRFTGGSGVACVVSGFHPAVRDVRLESCPSDGGFPPIVAAMIRYSSSTGSLPR
jgi:hypothetical protein